MENKNTFVDGLIVSKPKEGTPDFVKLRFGAKVDSLVAFLQKHKNEKGWVNFSLLKSKEKGNLYLSLDTYVKKEKPVDKDLPY